LSELGTEYFAVPKELYRGYKKPHSPSLSIARDSSVKLSANPPNNHVNYQQSLCHDQRLVYSHRRAPSQPGTFEQLVPASQGLLNPSSLADSFLDSANPVLNPPITKTNHHAPYSSPGHSHLQSWNNATDPSLLSVGRHDSFAWERIPDYQVNNEQQVPILDINMESRVQNHETNLYNSPFEFHQLSGLLSDSFYPDAAISSSFPTASSFPNTASSLPQQHGPTGLGKVGHVLSYVFTRECAPDRVPIALTDTESDRNLGGSYEPRESMSTIFRTRAQGPTGPDSEIAFCSNLNSMNYYNMDDIAGSAPSIDSSIGSRSLDFAAAGTSQVIYPSQLPSHLSSVRQNNSETYEDDTGECYASPTSSAATTASTSIINKSQICEFCGVIEEVPRRFAYVVPSNVQFGISLSKQAHANPWSIQVRRARLWCSS
jgi:hypothetical protein